MLHTESSKSMKDWRISNNLNWTGRWDKPSLLNLALSLKMIIMTSELSRTKFSSWKGNESRSKSWLLVKMAATYSARRLTPKKLTETTWRNKVRLQALYQTLTNRTLATRHQHPIRYLSKRMTFFRFKRSQPQPWLTQRTRPFTPCEVLLRYRILAIKKSKQNPCLFIDDYLQAKSKKFLCCVRRMKTW